ncbi:hypothetical protein ACFQ48_17785 [Hymenobacter caeli]|uniref:DUF1877 family protein n=1 Tax=Hymenobacter caeli TaxID=2735894 RepID=A0ABX2FUE5_9BACT|nr:hypothetical protein [Hymenobacter caeli]NRT20798.1 hypothetical protein [Hymenobacter caeli]
MVNSEEFITYYLTPKSVEYSTYTLGYSPVVIAEVFADYYNIRQTIIRKGHEIQGNWENGLSGRLSLFNPEETRAFSDLLTPLNPLDVANSNADRCELSTNSNERRDYLEHCVSVITEIQEFLGSAAASNQALVIYFGH